MPIIRFGFTLNSSTNISSSYPGKWHVCRKYLILLIQTLLNSINILSEGFREGQNVPIYKTYRRKTRLWPNKKHHALQNVSILVMHFCNLIKIEFEVYEKQKQELKQPSSLKANLLPHEKKWWSKKCSRP